ncbi:MAG TPA: molybdopterin molybdotransferase MoeA [Spirochaetota bacterium]|nr:MAG: Molybdopterin molybdenumtransferase [Spirochaetes bacterium ADurb.Bin133]HNZ26046.1 molybdopterin molybdotransferase MoeA [Spirochaetota bacterium]HPY88708.1 molybdopterin molybdotransferase MoeA [Spirochaetota bacterium]
MLEALSLSDALNLLELNFKDFIIKSETVNINESLGRYIYSDVQSDQSIPNFNRSTVDGYAVISSDSFGASDSYPCRLKLIGSIKMGAPPDISLSSGETVYIPTGGELPNNSDSVVMVEYTDNYKDGYIYLNKPSSPGNNVILKGEDCKQGDVVLKKGDKISVKTIGILAGLGISEIEVYKKITVGIISTGDEIADITKNLNNSQVRDINSYALFNELLNFGITPIQLGIVKDNVEDINRIVNYCLSKYDVILLSGGSSKGIKDETINVLNRIPGAKILFHGLLIKPGKPTISAKIGNIPFFGLPGQPLAAYFVYKRLVEPFLKYLYNDVSNQFTIKARLTTNYPSNNGREEAVIVKLNSENNEYIALPTFYKSGLISSLSKSDGFFIIPRESEGVMKDSIVDVVLF